MDSIWAKVDTYNQTSYETNTLSVLTEDDTRLTLRVDEHEVLIPGEVYLFEVEPIVFKERDQYLVKNYEHINDADIPLNAKENLMGTFYHFAPINIEEVKAIVESYLDRIEDDAVKTITLDVYKRFEKSFYLYPAATKFHHAYIGGVSYHTATMLKLVDGFVSTYPFLNEDLLIAGIVLHDVCKTLELSNYHAPQYTKEGKLIGHITMGVQEILKSAMTHNLEDHEARILLEHMILSHHYYGNYGSPKKPNIPEALALHFIDNIDSKMAVLGEELEKIEPGDFTQSIPVLERERYYKSTLTKKPKK